MALCALAVAGLIVSGCRPSGADRNEAAAAVTMLVAASARDAAEAVAGRYTERTGVPVRLSPAGSNQLAAQIIAGAPADIFLSASEEWTDEVRRRGLAARARPLLRNTLVLIVPEGNPAGVSGPADLAARRVQRVALAGENVPAGRYAEQALRAAGVYEALLRGGKIARGQDVRFALGYVERGEAEAGVVYATDARIARGVSMVHTFDRASHEPILYHVLLLESAHGNEPATRFYEFLASPAARRVFERFGFRPGPGDG